MTDDVQDIDCLEVLDRLHGYLDGELTAVRAAEVRRHLVHCAPCLQVSDFEAAYLRFLEARAQAQHAPASLRKRLLERLLFEDDPSTNP